VFFIERVYLLQWGHGDEAVEESSLGTHPIGPVALQWGHGDEAVEERRDIQRLGP